MLATPSFMSPEQIAGKKVDGRSDLYSLGVTLFQLLTGALPFRGDSMAELMYRIANEEPPDVRGMRDGVSDRLAQAVARSLAKRPGDRYEDGDAFAADLRALLVPSVSTASPVPTAAILTTTTAPGYDPGQQLQPGAGNVIARGAIFSWATGSGAPVGDGETDPQTATSGHL